MSGYYRCDEIYRNINGKNVLMINSYGCFSGEFVKLMNLPIGRQNENWLSKTQCKIIKRPVADEELFNGLVGFGRAMHGYYGLYFRELSEEEKILLKNKSKRR